MSQRTDRQRLAIRLAAHAGIVSGDERRRRGWTLRDLAARADLAVGSVHAVEHGRPAGLETYSALALGLELGLRLDLVDVRKRGRTVRAEDPVTTQPGKRRLQLTQ